MIDICITTHNSPNLEKCLSSLAMTKFADYNIYLLCNEANEETKRVLSKYRLDKVIHNNDNSGSFSSNNNRIAKEGDGDYILFLNDDVFPQRGDWLLNMSKILDGDDKVGAVGALLMYPDKQTVQHCGVFFSQQTNSLPYHMHYRQPLKNVKSFVSVSRYYQAVTGACLMVRRKDFVQVGGFCEDYFYCYEDIDLCLKIGKLNKVCVYCPGAVMIHNEGISKDGKNNPKFKENIALFKKRCTGMYFNDLEFYLSNPNHMIYRKGNVS